MVALMHACVQVDGVNLHYKDYGPKTPGAPAVLLLHGFNGSVFNWCGLSFPSILPHALHVMHRLAAACRRGHIMAPECPYMMLTS